MTRQLDDDQQQNAEGIGNGCEQAQVLRCRELGEGNHGGDRNGDISQMMLDHFQVLSGGAIHHQNPEAHDDGQYAGQGAVQSQGTQGAAAGGQGASGSGRREFVEDHKTLPRAGILSAAGALSGNR